jgi:hypothetical protein
MLLCAYLKLDENYTYPRPRMNTFRGSSVNTATAAQHRSNTGAGSGGRSKRSMCLLMLKHQNPQMFLVARHPSTASAN